MRSWSACLTRLLDAPKPATPTIWNRFLSFTIISRDDHLRGVLSTSDPSARLTTLRVAVAQGHIPRIHEQLKLAASSPKGFTASNLKHDLKHITQLVLKRIESPKAKADQSIQDIVTLLASFSIFRPLVSYIFLLLKHNQLDYILPVWELTRENASQSLTPSSTLVHEQKKCLSEAFGYVISAAYLTRGKRSALSIAISYPNHLDARWTDAFFRGANMAEKVEADALASLMPQLKLARLLVRPANAIQHIKHLIRGGNSSALLQFFENAVEGMSGKDPWIAPSDAPLFANDARYLVSFTESLWSLLLSGLMRLESMGAAHAAWKKMTELRVEKTVISWNALLDGFGRYGQHDELMTVWKSMDQAHIRKDFFSYTTIISSLFRLRRPNDAMAIFEEMRVLADIPQSQLEVQDDSVEPTGGVFQQSSTRGSATFACNAVIHGLLISSRLDDAKRILETMVSRGPQPDVSTYNTFLRYHVRRDDYPAIAAILHEISLKGLRPDVFTFTSVAHAYLRQGKHDAIQRLEEVMARTGVRPNAVTYTAIIDSVVKQGGQANIETGIALIQKMSEQGLWPNEITFTSVMAALYKDSSLNPKFVDSKKKEIEARMGNAGIPANRVTFHVLISAQLDAPGAIGMSNALHKYQEMVEAGIQPRDDTFYMLLRGAVIRRDTESGARILQEMDRIGFIPQGAVARLVSQVQKDASIA